MKDGCDGPTTPGRFAGLYRLKPWYTRRLSFIVDHAVAHGISPDVYTVIGLAAGTGAGVAIASGSWPLAAALLALRLAGANLDGAVARAARADRPWGFVVNEIGDRAADLAMFGGLTAWAASQRFPAVHGICVPVAAMLIAAAAATLPTFASLAVTAAGGGSRRNGGPFGKTERCVAAVVATAWPAAIVWVAALIIVGSVTTAAMRLAAGRRELLGAPA
jgi:CDP-diacylglycerol--glycerol-3-phosphate 3-phosphatidyltransferase